MRIARAVIASLLVPLATGAQSSLRDRYLESVPPSPLIVAQNAGTARVMLYGDATSPDYRDVAPSDGVDDARAERLRAIADRFLPLLRRTNFSVPRRIDDVLPGVTFHVDRWRNGRIEQKDSIPLHQVAIDPAVDERLLALIAALGPRRVIPAITRPRARDETIIFIDFPGEDEGTWRDAYDRPGARPHVYVHPFIDEIGTGERTERFHFVVQYWFFYPFNDATNNHEGDWEHINVRVTTAARFARDRKAALGSPLAEDEVRRIAGGGWPVPLDSLVIQGVDYYFHHSVVMVDYATVDVNPGSSSHSAHTTTHIWEDAGFINDAIRQRLTVAEGRLATHPVGYIGGVSRGPGELRHVVPNIRRARDANSNGTYPYPGLWVSVGQLATTEMLGGNVVPNTRSVPADAPWREIVNDDDYVVFGPTDFTLLPDWERLEPLVMSDTAARARWAWMLLPVHFGFPASPSPAGGVLRRTNLGNVSPEGPTFHPDWNLSGESLEHSLHTVSVLRGPAAPAGPWLALQSGWGVMNVPLALLGLMPGYGVGVATAVPYVVGARRALGRPTTRILFRGTLPPRVTSTGYGVFRDRGRLDPSTSRSLGGERLWFDLYFGNRVALENTFGWSSSKAGYAPAADGGTVGRVRYRQLTGGTRINLTGRETGVLQLFARGGYGWTRHDLDAVVIAGDTLAGTGQRRGYLPSLLPSKSWWPNTLYGGVGVELFAPRHRWVLHRAGYGIRTDLTLAASRTGHRSVEASTALVLGW